MTLCHTTDVVRQKSAEWLLDLSFGHMMACRLFCTEPLYEPLLINWTLRNKCYITFICIWTVLFCYQLMITDTTYHRHVADNTIILPCEVMQHNRNAIHISVQNNENNKTLCFVNTKNMMHMVNKYQYGISVGQCNSLRLGHAYSRTSL